jgi:lipopolysaccharide/colanic/teichoic acid biosynthesis glycosyltransferase
VNSPAVFTYSGFDQRPMRAAGFPLSNSFSPTAVPFDAQFNQKQQTGLILKRTMDLIGAFLALVFFLPLMLLIAAVLKATSPGPVLFAHRRLGKDGRAFHCLKFRSMVANSAAVLAVHLAENPLARAEWARDHKLRDDPRITWLGKFLRRSSLDELPQFINVLVGEMSLVGPRPIVLDEVAKYGRYISYYTSVTPGITGLWQISGRNDMSYRRRVAIDTAYARNRCAQLDLAIMLRTLPAVLAAKGAH